MQLAHLCLQVARDPTTRSLCCPPPAHHSFYLEIVIRPPVPGCRESPQRSPCPLDSLSLPTPPSAWTLLEKSLAQMLRGLASTGLCGVPSARPLDPGHIAVAVSPITALWTPWGGAWGSQRGPQPSKAEGAPLSPSCHLARHCWLGFGVGTQFLRVEPQPLRCLARAGCHLSSSHLRLSRVCTM